MSKSHRFLGFLLLSALVGLGPSANSEVSMRWAVGAWDGAGGSPQGIQKDTELETGSRLKILVEPMSTGSFYLILLDSSDEITVLYRESGESLPTDPEARATYIPPGRQWFELDGNTGMETFFFLASAEPLTELEALLDSYESADATSRNDLVSAIVGEIRKQHRAHRQLSRPVEKPVVIGGRTRGDGPSIDEFAVEINAEGFYGKTITIDH